MPTKDFIQNLFVFVFTAKVAFINQNGAKLRQILILKSLHFQTKTKSKGISINFTVFPVIYYHFATSIFQHLPPFATNLHFPRHCIHARRYMHHPVHIASCACADSCRRFRKVKTDKKHRHSVHGKQKCAIFVRIDNKEKT